MLTVGLPRVVHILPGDSTLRSFPLSTVRHTHTTPKLKLHRIVCPRHALFMYAMVRGALLGWLE